MIDRRFFRNIDFWMIFATLALVGIGILVIGSAIGTIILGVILAITSANDLAV